jgi:tRNA 2-thiouridine synthesizing protein A
MLKKHKANYQEQDMNKNVDLELDLIGLESPAPMLKTKEVIDTLATGQILLVKTSSVGSEQNIRNLIGNHPVTLLSFKKEDGIFHFLIEKNAANTAQ